MGVQCFGEFGASGRARIIACMGPAQIDLIKTFSPIRPSRG